ncbi:helix-turn-helix domain-containing protein [Enterococcus faecalis]|nr:helix-turn-helix domain-containing protein [Enterococcus faecalis]
MFPIYFLPKKNKDKLLIIHALCYQDWSTDSLSLHLNRKKRYVKDLLRELKEDVKYYQLNGTPQISVHKNGKITVDHRNAKIMLKFFYTLKLAYLKEVNEFKLFDLFIKNPKLSILSISDSLYTSLSYTRRIIKKLNNYLDKFHFQIIEKMGICELKGNELSIRLFLYVLMNDAYNSFCWPYTLESLPKRINYRQSLHIMLTIMISRKSYNAIVSELTKKNNCIINQLKENYNFISYLNLENTFLDNELNDPLIEKYFIFLGHICAPQAIPKHIKIKLGKIFSNDSNNGCIFAKNLYNKMSTNFKMNNSLEKKYLLIYYLTILNCFYEIMQETTTLFEELIFPQLDYPLLFEQSEAKKIMSLFQEFLYEESSTKLLDNNNLQLWFCGLIYIILQTEKKNTVRIYLYLTKNLTAQDLVQSRLESIYNSDKVLFTDCIEESDLIVTDSLNFDKKIKNELFYFNPLIQTNQWKHLLKKINQIILKKDFEEKGTDTLK